MKNWIEIIDKAQIGCTLQSLNYFFGTNSKISLDDRFGTSLNRAFIDALGYRMQIQFDYGDQCNEITFWPQKKVEDDDFTKQHLTEFLSKYSKDFKMIKHYLHTGSISYFYYSEKKRLLVSVSDGLSGVGFGPITISRPPNGPKEIFLKLKNQKYRTTKYNFANPDKFIDIKNTVNYTAIPIKQVRNLIRAGITKIPAR